MSVTVRRTVAAMLACLWLATLTQPVATTSHLAGDQTFSGIGILFLGTLGPLGLIFSWYANPVLLLGLILSVRPLPRPKAAFVWLALIIALLVVDAVFWRQIPDDSGDNPINRYHAGYWLWMTTMALASAWFAALGFSRNPAAR